MKDNIHFIELSKVDLPVVYSDSRRNKWVNYGDDNLFPNKVNELLNYSAVHKNIINLKTNLITGNGFIDDKGDPIELNLNSIEPDKETLKKIAQDYSTLNGFSIQVLWDRTGKNISQVLHSDFARWRAEYNEHATPDAYFYSRNWERYTLQRNKPEAVNVYNPKSVIQKGKDGKDEIVEARQIFYFYEKQPDLDYYPVPSYSPAFKDIEFDNEYGMFKANSMKNGMFPATHVSILGDPSDEEIAKLKNTIKENWLGSSNAGGVFVTASAIDGGGITISPIDVTQNADKFIAWKDDAVQNIITAHNLTSPTLAGIPGNGNLSGNANELIVALEQFQTNYIETRQDNIVGVLKKILKDKEGSPEDFKIASKRPFSIVPDILWDIMTDEDIERISKEKFGIELQGTSINRGVNEEIKAELESLKEEIRLMKNG